MRRWLTKSLAFAVASAVVLTAQTGPHETRAKAIFKQLVEINTTQSVGNTTTGRRGDGRAVHGRRFPGRRRARARAVSEEGQPRRALSRHGREAADDPARTPRRRRGQARGLVVRSVRADREGRLLLRSRHGRRQDDGRGVRGQPASSQVGRFRAGARHHPDAHRRRGRRARERRQVAARQSSRRSSMRSSPSTKVAAA